MVAQEVEKTGPAKNKTALAKRMPGRYQKNLESIVKAVELGWLKVSESGEINLGSKPLFGREFGRESGVTQPTGISAGIGNQDDVF